MKNKVLSVGFITTLLGLIAGGMTFIEPARADLWCWSGEKNCEVDGKIGTSGNTIFGNPKPRGSDNDRREYPGGFREVPVDEGSLEDPNEEPFDPGEDPRGSYTSPFETEDEGNRDPYI
jgi:hypothetical protein